MQQFGNIICQSEQAAAGTGGFRPGLFFNPVGEGVPRTEGSCPGHQGKIRFLGPLFLNFFEAPKTMFWVLSLQG
jgi:hypothetical protein